VDLRDDSASMESLVCSALRGEPLAWVGSEQDLKDLVRYAERHGVVPLLLTAALRSGWPAPAADVLRKAARPLVMWELRHQHVLSGLLRALTDAGVTPVLIKGTALAYSLYEDPTHRTRGDTDLLVDPAARQLTADTLKRQGFRPLTSVTGEFVSYQSTFQLQAPDGTSHAIDLHWRINNSQVLAGAFTHAEFVTQGEASSLWGNRVRLPSKVQSLLVACLHRSTHRHNPYHVGGEALFDPNRLIWLMDIDLLARAMDDGQWRDVCAQAQLKGFARVCLDGLREARSRFLTPVPEEALSTLAACPPGAADGYLAASGFTQQILDWAALPGSRARLRYAREVFLPPTRYMRERYGLGPNAWMPWFYLRRAVRGTLARVRRSTHST
jgi:hypothetical protein